MEAEENKVCVRVSCLKENKDLREAAKRGCYRTTNTNAKTRLT